MSTRRSKRRQHDEDEEGQQKEQQHGRHKGTGTGRRRSRRNGGSGTGSGALDASWHSLTQDLQEAVMLLVEPSERYTVSGVCRNWRDVVHRHQRKLIVDLDRLVSLDDASGILAAATKRPLLSSLDAWVGQVSGDMALLGALLTKIPGLKELKIGSDISFELPMVAFVLAPQLTSLDLHHPDGLPDCLNCLPELRQLSATLGDSMEVTLPTAITQLRHLSSLVFTGPGAAGAPVDMGAAVTGLKAAAALPGLRKICLGGLFIGGLEWLRGCTQIAGLVMSDCRRDVVDGDEEAALLFGAGEYGDALGPLTQLHTLDLSYAGLEQMPACVAAMPRLDYLCLDGNNRMSVLPRGPYQQSLKALSLESCCALCARHTLPVLQGMPALQVLYLSGTGLDDPGTLEQILAALPRLSALTISEDSDLSAEGLRRPGLQLSFSCPEEPPSEGEDDEEYDSEDDEGLDEGDFNDLDGPFFFPG